MDRNRLLSDMNSPDAQVRMAAREELIEEMNDEVAAAILDIASGRAGEEVRADALIALGPIIEECSFDYDDLAPDIDLGPEMDPSISRTTFATLLDRIREIYSDEAQPKIVRRRALEVLIRNPAPWLTAEIRRHSISADDEWRRTAVFAMGMITGFEREIAATVATADGELLFEAVRAAGEMEVTSAASRIRELALTEGGDPDTRIAAILALPKVDRHAFELLDELTGSDDDEVSEAAEEAIEELSLWEKLDEGRTGDEEDE